MKKHLVAILLLITTLIAIGVKKKLVEKVTVVCFPTETDSGCMDY